MYVLIDPDKLGKAHRYANLLRNKPKREYAFAYIAWLRNGAEGPAPERGKGLSFMGAQAVQMEIDGMKLWEGARIPGYQQDESDRRPARIDACKARACNP